MNTDEVMAGLERLGATLCGLGLGSGDGEVLYTLVPGREGDVSVVIRCGEDCVLARVEDVAYVGRTTKGLKVHLKGCCGSVSMLTLGPGRSVPKSRGRGRSKGD